MGHRFYIPPADWNPIAPAMTGAEARHATSVLRMRAGDAAVLFDGRGNEQAVQVGTIARDRVDCLPGAVSSSAPQRCRIALAQAIPKGKNMDLILQKATELGAAAIHPLVTERTVARPDRAEADSKREKWQRVAIEACKQCGQNFLPEISTPLSFGEFLARRAGDYQLVIIASLQPGARHLKEILASRQQANNSPPASVLLLIGPEGDFTEEEVRQALDAGAQPMCLGPIILRTETAALYGLSVLAHELQAVPATTALPGGCA